MDKTEYKEYVWSCFFWGWFDVICITLFVLMIISNDVAGIICFSIITPMFTIIEIALIVEIIKEKRKIEKEEFEIKEIEKEASEKTYKELKMNWETLIKQEEIYENLKIRDKVCKNKFGKIKNKKLQDDFLNEIIDRDYFPYDMNIITIKDVIDKIKDYKFRYREMYVEKLAEYEKMQEILDKYNTLEENDESKTKICNRKKV